MEVNYYIVIPVGLVVFLLLIWLMRRNSKDKAKYEKSLIDSDTRPEKHQDGGI